MGPTGPRGAAGVKGEQVSEGKVFRGGSGESCALLTSDISTYRVHQGWFFLETLAPREIVENG